MRDTATYPRRRLLSIKAAIETMEKREGAAMHQSAATAVAEVLAVPRITAYFSGRNSRADLAAFTRSLKRKRPTVHVLPIRTGSFARGVHKVK